MRGWDLTQIFSLPLQQQNSGTCERGSSVCCRCLHQQYHGTKTQAILNSSQLHEGQENLCEYKIQLLADEGNADINTNFKLW